MQHIFLTSFPFTEPGMQLNESNRFTERLSACLRGTQKALYVTSSPADITATEYFSQMIRHTLELSGLVFSDWAILDDRNKAHAAELVRESGFIILSGGHVPTQNAFFAETGLRGCIRDFNGTVLGISAGSMNAAETVYAQPEEEGEAVDPAYQRFLTGLGLTETMLIPHYQQIKDDILDGMKLFEEITYPDSFGRQFIALCDGSYLYADGVTERICGKAYRIRDGQTALICTDGNEYILSGRNNTERSDQDKE